MAGMVTRDPSEPRAAMCMVPFLLGFAAGEWLGGFVASLLIAQCKKWGGAGGWGIDGYRAGTYDMPSARRRTT